MVSLLYVMTPDQHLPEILPIKINQGSSIVFYRDFNKRIVLPQQLGFKKLDTVFLFVLPAFFRVEFE
nr:hypothetical protein [Chlorobium phaeobacteroides]